MIVSDIYGITEGFSVLQLKHSFINNKYHIGAITNTNVIGTVRAIGVDWYNSTPSQIKFITESILSFTFIVIGNWK